MNDERVYTVNEIFYSIQGEGIRMGTANIFLRFAGCNLTCNQAEQGFDCDTEFTSGRKMTANQMLTEIREIAPQADSIIFTGGEPSLQVTPELIQFFKSHEFYLAIETNGTKELPEGIDWITVSPKTAEHTLRQKKASEVKYVRSRGQAIPRPTVEADFYLISPACQPHGFDPTDLAWCVNLIKENPQWRMSLQTHKLLKVR